MSIERERTAPLEAMEHDVDDESPLVSAAGTKSRWWRPRASPIGCSCSRSLRQWCRSPSQPPAPSTVSGSPSATTPSSRFVPGTSSPSTTCLLGTWSSSRLDRGAEPEPSGPASVRRVSPAGETRWWHRPGEVGSALINAMALLGIAIVGYRRGGAVVGAAAVAVGAGAGLVDGQRGALRAVAAARALAAVPLLCDSRVGRLVRRSRHTAVGGRGRLRRPDASELRHPRSTPRSVGGRRCRARAARGPATRPKLVARLRGRAVRIGVIAAAVFAVCWLQPLIEQFTSDGDGNLTRLVQHARDSNVKTVGFGFRDSCGCVRRIAAAVVAPPIVREHVFASRGLAAAVAAPCRRLTARAGGCARVVLSGGDTTTRPRCFARHRDRRVVLLCLSSVLEDTHDGCSAPNRTCSDGPGPLAAFMVLAIAVAVVRRFARLSVAITACALVAPPSGS